VGSFRIKQVVPDLVLEDICLGAGEIIPCAPCRTDSDTASGQKCGATFVDRAFLDMFRTKVGLANFRNLTRGTLETTVGSHTALSRELYDLLKAWEPVKRDFTGEAQYERFIMLPRSLAHLELPDKGISEGELRVTGFERFRNLSQVATLTHRQR
jgi:hypothetical protein